MMEHLNRQGPIKMKNSLLLLLSLLIVSCASLERKHWDEWIDPEVAVTPAEAVAILDWPDIPFGVQSIDGDTSAGVRHIRARLSPGKHVVKYEFSTGEFGSRLKGIIEIDLTAGHSYEVQLKLCFWCIPRKYAIWVDDKTTNQLVWGKRPDWPSWYL